MRIYVHDDKTEGTIAKACVSLGVEVLTAQDVRARTFSDKSAQRNEFFLDSVDALILEITRPTQDIHFILAQAIITQKPTLCVYGKNQTPRELLSYIKRGSTSKIIKTFSYIEEQLSATVTAFVYRYDPRFASQLNMPEIKFTLRLTQRIDEYVLWKSKKTGRTKAECIRDILESQAQDDEQFLGWLSKQKKK